MNLPASSVLTLLLAASMLPAQGNFLTSPSSLASTDGNQSLAFSEGTGTRWQQIHGDLTGPARLLLGLRLRRDELVPALPTATSRQITVEVLVGETDLTLVGRPVHAHVRACRSGHRLNAALASRLVATSGRRASA
jgi:hypothetical protein